MPYKMNKRDAIIRESSHMTAEEKRAETLWMLYKVSGIPVERLEPAYDAGFKAGRSAGLEEAAQLAEDEVAPGEQRYYLTFKDGSRATSEDTLAFNTAVCEVGDKIAAAIRTLV